MPKVEGTTTKKAAAKKVASPAPEPDAELDLDGEFGFADLDDTIDFVNILSWGREGSGKTTGAARIANAFSHMPPDQGKVLIINAEGGLKKGALAKRGVDTSRIKIWPDPRKHERVTHQSLDRLHRKVKADLMKDPLSWGGVVMDSASEAHIAILDVVQNKRVVALMRAGKDPDPDFVDISDYGTMSKLFRDVLRKFRDLPCHFVVTALERRDVDKDTGKPQYGPAVTPGLQSDLLGYVDFVLFHRAEDEDGPYRALTRGNARYRAKDRFDVLPRIMVDPYADRIIAYVNGDLTPETDPEQERLQAERPEEEQEDETDTADDDE